MTFDITEKLQIDITGAGSAMAYTNNEGYTYDVSVNNLAFFDASNRERPYRRETAQYRKDQSDNSSEPGEQSLMGWWLRSQSSFHYGAGANFYEPAQDEKLRFRFYDSEGLNVWTPGEVTLLRGVTDHHIVTSNEHTHLRSIRYNATDAVLLHDEHDVDKIDANGTVHHYVDYNAGTDDPVYSICDDGIYAYFVTNKVSTANKMHFFKKPLTGDSTTGTASASPTGDVTLMFQDNAIVSSATLEWVKGRIIACINNSVYEIVPSTSSLPSPIFTNPSTSFVFTAVTASAGNIYVAGNNAEASVIYRLPLDTDGTFTTLSAGVVVAELPRGEIVHSIKAYLGYMAIGTNKGVRVAQLMDDGGIIYGPLLFTTDQPVYEFAASDRFLWAACGVHGDTGLVRIDLGTQVETLRFAYANDLQAVGSGRHTGGVAFAGSSDRLVFTSLDNGTNGTVYIENDSVLRSSGWLTTGKIRFNTTEDKYFKYVKERADYADGGTVTLGTTSSDITTASAEFGNQDVAINENAGVEYKQFKFTLTRNSTTTSQGPTFNGYQVKAIPATRRQRLIQFQLYMFDKEIDRFGNVIGWDGRAFERLSEIEELEGYSNIVRIQDFRTDEVFDALIEQTQFTSTTPPSRQFDGFGGYLTLTVRKL